jgi:hypothetical protein
MSEKLRKKEMEDALGEIKKKISTILKKNISSSVLSNLKTNSEKSSVPKHFMQEFEMICKARFHEFDRNQVLQVYLATIRTGRLCSKHFYKGVLMEIKNYFPLFNPEQMYHILKSSNGNKSEDEEEKEFYDTALS